MSQPRLRNTASGGKNTARMLRGSEKMRFFCFFVATFINVRTEADNLRNAFFDEGRSEGGVKGSDSGGGSQ